METDLRCRVFYIYGAQVVAYGVYTAIKEVINKNPGHLWSAPLIITLRR